MERGGRLISILVVILIIVVGLWIYNYLTVPMAPSLQMPSFMKSDLGSPVLILDMNANGQPTLPDLLSGEDAMLVVHQNVDPANHSNDSLFASNVVLAVFDKNKDGRIDVHDRLYKQLELRSANKEDPSVFTYMPIAQAGIRAIYIDPRYYNKFSPNNAYPQGVGTAIMADGTARLIRQVIVDETYFRSAAPTNTALPASTPATPVVPAAAPAATPVVPVTTQPAPPVTTPVTQPAPARPVTPSVPSR